MCYWSIKLYLNLCMFVLIQREITMFLGSDQAPKYALDRLLENSSHFVPSKVYIDTEQLLSISS